MDRSTAIICFNKYFQSRNIFENVLMSAITGKYDFDIIAFDTWCHEVYGYTEEAHGSLKDFISLRFGEDASEFISNCLRQTEKKQL